MLHDCAVRWCLLDAQARAVTASFCRCGTSGAFQVTDPHGFVGFVFARRPCQRRSRRLSSESQPSEPCGSREHQRATQSLWAVDLLMNWGQEIKTALCWWAQELTHTSTTQAVLTGSGSPPSCRDVEPPVRDAGMHPKANDFSSEDMATAFVLPRAANKMLMRTGSRTALRRQDQVLENDTKIKSVRTTSDAQ